MRNLIDVTAGQQIDLRNGAGGEIVDNMIDNMRRPKVTDTVLRSAAVGGTKRALRRIIGLGN